MRTKKLVLLYFGCLGALTALVLMFGIAVDPYGIFGSSSFLQKHKWKPAQVKKTRFAKAMAVLHKQPDAIILGNSRSEYGLDPDHPFFTGTHAYNLAFSSQTIYESLHYLIHANTVNPLKKVVIGIDFDLFGSHAQTGFNEDMLCDETKHCFPRLRLLKECLSSEYLSAAIDTIRNDQITRYHHRDNGIRDPEHNNFFIAKEGGYRNAFHILERHVMDNFSGGVARVNNKALHIFREMLQYLYDRNIETVLLISPSHARYSELLNIRKQNGFETLLQWKKSVVEVNYQIALETGRAPYPIWDFSVLNQYTTEALPPHGKPEMKMAYHWDTSHYKKKLGDLILDDIMKKNGMIGVLLTPKNIDQHLESLRKSHTAWAATNFDIHEFENRFKEAEKVVKGNEYVFPELENIKTHDLEVKDNGEALVVKGKDPYVIFALKDKIDGSVTKYVGFDFQCIGKTGQQPRLQLFWWDSRNKWFAEKRSIRGKVDEGRIAIDFSALDDWETSTSINALRVDLANYKACEAIKLEGLFYGPRTASSVPGYCAGSPAKPGDRR